jgi:hypothetical protein
LIVLQLSDFCCRLTAVLPVKGCINNIKGGGNYNLTIAFVVKKVKPLKLSI